MFSSDRGQCYIDPAMSQGSRCGVEGQPFIPLGFVYVHFFLGAFHLLFFQTEKAVTGFLQVRFLFRADGTIVRS